MVNVLKRLLSAATGSGSDAIDKQRLHDYACQVESINRALAVIEFELDGTIVSANANFLSVMGYTESEVVGQKHSMFAEAGLANSPEYSRFWARLNDGVFESGEFKRIAKGGREVWIHATYNPITDESGKVYKVIKYASDITAEKLRGVDSDGQLDAISKSQAVIEFDLNGNILTANENFLSTLGYSLSEIIGRHHRQFVDSETANSREYQDFWQSLKHGTYQSGEFKRIDKSGKVVWIQASYNPILDLNGAPYKVVKFAADITAQKELQGTITNVLRQTSEIVEGMARGDLSSRLEGNFSGEFAQLQASVNECIERMNSTLAEINGLATQVSIDSNEIADGNNTLNARALAQASTVVETSSSIHQLTTTVQQNAENAHNASQLVTTVSDQARKGGDIVEKAVQAMGQLHESSNDISEIIGVINEIAFQTNLLALNASVEAARAGSQGRGFAVVASEVRDLAGRSATAANQIKDIIESSGKRVNETNELVARSGKSLKEIVAGIDKVTSIVGDIATASKEQSYGIGEVNKAIVQIDELTQQNTIIVEKASQASENLKNEATELTTLVSSFKLDNAGHNGQRAAVGVTQRKAA